MKNCDICNTVLNQSMPVVDDPIKHARFSIWICSYCTPRHTTAGQKKAEAINNV